MRDFLESALLAQNFCGCATVILWQQSACHVAGSHSIHDGWHMQSIKLDDISGQQGTHPAYPIGGTDF